MKARSLPLSSNGLPILVMFPAHQALITLLATFAGMPKADSGPISESEELCQPS
jgi:hypothetical protein